MPRRADCRRSSVPRRATGCALALLFVLALDGCGLLAPTPGPDDQPPWKATPDLAATDPPRPTPDAQGLVPGCPLTLVEVSAIVPQITRGPDVGQPFKNITGDCQFWVAETGGEGFTLLVFDAEGQGVAMWASSRTDPAFPNATDVAGVGDDAFVAGERDWTDLFSVKGQVALHIMASHGLTIQQLAALARAAYARLGA
jgi:hypothetical protein